MITLTINGERREVDVPPDMPLLWVLRDALSLTGTKFRCGIAQCGASTIHIDNKPTRSCLLPVGAIGTRAITTIEAVGRDAARRTSRSAPRSRVGGRICYFDSSLPIQDTTMKSPITKASWMRWTLP